MGRGRAKAKQTKVARQLKYFSPETDYDALQRELHGPDRYSASGRADAEAAAADDDEEQDDGPPYAVDDDYEEWAAKRRA
ncbi:DUF3073 domain-containing protein [Kineococcus glutinatus]|uniref:DUF3073 domain-containing protein n=1 Tax=Kineococcus glutinatus TaxID=1070872 RepID=A0ABP9I4C8_9ACTN